MKKRWPAGIALSAIRRQVDEKQKAKQRATAAKRKAASHQRKTLEAAAEVRH